MDSLAAWTIFGVFVLAWIAPLIVILHYRVVIVKDRFAEIKEALIEPAHLADSPARHYLKLFTRRSPEANATVAELERAIDAHLLQFQSWSRYAMSLFLVAAFSFGALYLVWAWVTKTFAGTSPFGPIGPVLEKEAVFALTGAYTWSLFELADRARRRDLTPDELFDVSIRYLFAVPIGYVGTLLSIDGVDGAFAFAASAFPLKDVRRWIRKRAIEKMKLEEAPRLESTRAGYLTQVVDGLGPDTVARLEEIGIVTATDLAYADPTRIMLKAGFSLRHILQWMDHAMLAVYALDHKQKLAGSAVTCALDAKEFYEIHFMKVGDNGKPVLLSTRECPAVNALQERMGVPAVLLGEIFMRVAVDPQVLFLDKMWYTGYPADQKERPDLPPCTSHSAA